MNRVPVVCLAVVLALAFRPFQTAAPAQSRALAARDKQPDEARMREATEKMLRRTLEHYRARVQSLQKQVTSLKRQNAALLGKLARAGIKVDTRPATQPAASLQQVFREYEDAVEFARREAVVKLRGLAETRVGTGDLSGAVAAYKSILRIDPDNAHAKKQLAGSEPGQQIQPKRIRPGPTWRPSSKSPLKPQQVTIYACGCNNLELYVDRELVLRFRRESLGIAKATLKEGSVIQVSNGDRFDINSQWVQVNDGKGNYLFGTSTKWVSYLPPKSKDWLDVRPQDLGKTIPAKPVVVSKGREYDHLIRKAQRDCPNFASDPIVSNVIREPTGNRSCMLYVVQGQDLVPKSKPERQ